MGHPVGHPTPDNRDEADIAALDGLIARETLSIVFQPIVDLREARIAGYEALARPDSSTPFTGAVELFDAAERHGRLDAVEGIARRKALQTIRRDMGSGLLFINNSPLVVTGESYLQQIRDEIDAAPGVTPHDIVLEITERTGHGMHEELVMRSLELREHAFRVAIDDVGAGISGLNQIMAIRPNWIKLDIELISNIDLDPLRQNLIRFFVHFAKLGNMRLIAEGIERVEELRVLIELGVTYGQGFLLGCPESYGADLGGDVKRQIAAAQERSASIRCFDTGAVNVGALSEETLVCDITDPVSEVRERVLAASEVPGVAVLNGRRYVGWLEQAELEALRLPTTSARTIGTLPICTAPLIGPNTSLAEALDITAAMPAGRQTLPLIVQNEGTVSGMVTLRRLLQAAADSHRRAPSHIAPLTGLPSRVQADQWLARRIRTSDPADITVIDLRNFDAYNLAYGFEKGDEMLIGLVGLIRSHLVDIDDGADFFAHLGEDRFMLAFSTPVMQRLDALMEAFNELQAKFFSSVDLATGAFGSEDPIDDAKAFPLTSLRVIYLPRILVDIHEPRDLHFIARRLSLRSYDTKADEHAVITDRRGGQREAMAEG
jgi:EAL domain-containing protein (putative c-di-GMP-specific phosphodiesterase class I)/GGDEF domain-containing protein